MDKVITGVTEYRAIKGFRPYLGIGIDCAGAAGTDYFSNVRAELRLVDGSKGRDEKIIPDIKLSVLFEFAAKGNGQFYLKADKSAFSGMIDLTDFDGIDLSSQKYLELNLYGLSAAATYTVHGIDADEFGGYFYRWSKMEIQASVGNQTMRYENEKAEYLVLPIANLIEVNMINKKQGAGTKRWNLADCKKHMQFVNPIVSYNENGGVVCGYGDCVILDVDDISTYEITTDGTAFEFYTVDVKAE